MENYDARDVSVIINGTYITGFSEGSFISTEKDEENYITHVGAKGEVARARNANPLGTITLELKSTSPSNGFLNQLAKSKDLFEIEVIDANENAKKIGGSEAWVEVPAPLTFSNEIETIEWTIKVADYTVDIL